MHPGRTIKALLAALACLILISAALVTVLRWVNPPFTAYMLETRARLARSGEQRTPLRRDWVPINRISGAMCLAVVASEDQTFPSNHGFDFGAIKKAIRHNAHHESLRGASTLTQQTAKNLFLWPGKTYFRKAVGAYFTVLIDLIWPKRRVLEVYLNSAQFNPTIFGVGAAAQHFFGRRPAELDASQAALLAATLPAPGRYSVSRPSPYLRRRQRWIINQMHHLGENYLSGIGVPPAGFWRGKATRQAHPLPTPSPG